MPVLRR